MLRAINWQIYNYFGFVCGMELLHLSQKKYSFSKAAVRRQWLMCEDAERTLFEIYVEVCVMTSMIHIIM